MNGRNRLLSFMDLDLLLMIILGIFSAAFLIQTRTYNPTAALFPRLVSAATLLLILWTIGYRFWNLLHKTQVSSESGEEVSARSEGVMKWYVSLATMTVYFLLIYFLGFTWATLVYLLAVPLLLGYRKYRIIILVAGLWTIAFVFSMTYIMQARIPGGLLGSFYQWVTSK